MAVSPDDRFAGLLTSSAERGGWVPGDVVTSDTAGDEEPVEPRRVRLPVLIALAVATIAVLVLAYWVLRPADTEQAPSAPAPVATDAPAPGAGDAAPGGQRAAGETGGASPEADPAAEVVVHVTGEVENPSVVTLAGGSRVRDAVDAAGGLTADADAEAVNLARIVADGEQIWIPAVGEDPPASAPTVPAPSGADGSGSSGAESSGSGSSGSGGGSDASGSGTGAKIDLNTADSTTLQTLPGVGPVTAEAIIAHREATPFTSVEDLLLVKGIGPKTFESLKDLVTVG
ncbi:ComEA family DNA-binding protein [Brevibacterium casei]|uniref:Competence protein ComEA-like protein with helix-hairpin-helix repeat region n=2 Tax=Brevibacterium casei TaxID=33889 RepID=K9APH6_9MICO|nr:ComEA family DNA-binding protein [Brevibacterium casei]EKU47876.1 competence protein ComEA-like protein with helix-hairpin-helix repeat region [Brevibacterium casei S18]KZE18117.1 competence protein ComEA [Brevibacterium casei]MBE4694010.1 ComEA family DNA-binding protein [Brevibacterium casei]MBY3577133.1 ComEA family DNA-binding protein [Brevibacterium casei]MCT1766554.1 ComEA family DNA-binding protein [Brevibacterium casei]